MGIEIWAVLIAIVYAVGFIVIGVVFAQDPEIAVRDVIVCEAVWLIVCLSIGILPLCVYMVVLYVGSFI